MRTCEERTRDVLARRDAYRKKQQRQQSAIALCMLCGALVLSVCLGMLPRFQKAPAVDAASYEEIYKAVDSEKLYQYYLHSGDDEMDMAVPETGMTEVVTNTVANNATGHVKDYSSTNLQVVGVDEADVIKSDGRFLYVLSGVRVVIVDPNDGAPKKLVEFVPDADGYRGSDLKGLYLAGERLIVMQNCYTERQNKTAALIYDIKAPENPRLVARFEQDGLELSSRIVGDVLYTVTQYTIRKKPDQNDPATFVPRIGCDEESAVMAAEDICISEESARYIVVTAVRVSAEGERLSQKAVLTSGNTVYANTENLYVAGDNYGTRKTNLLKFALNGGKLEKMAETEIEGTLLNQFSLDEHNGYLRVVVTEYGEGITTNALLVLDANLTIVGSLKGLAEDERVYSVRFDGDVGYFVTFRQVDPLFTVDLSDPTKPVIQSQLKIPGFSQYLHPYGKGLLLGIGMHTDENGRSTFMKLSMFDVSDPTAVTESDVFVLDQRYGEVLYNHKAVLIDIEKNLIGFATADNTYHVYGYDPENGFTLKARVAALDGNSTRGIYIGEYLYVTSSNGVLSYRLHDFSGVGALSIVQPKAGTVSTAASVN